MEFSWGFGIEKRRGLLGEFAVISVSLEIKHEESSENLGKIQNKIRGRIQDKNSKDSGHFRSAIFLT